MFSGQTAEDNGYEERKLDRRALKNALLLWYDIVMMFSFTISSDSMQGLLDGYKKVVEL